MARKSMRIAKTARRSSRPSVRLDVDVPVSQVMVADPLCVGPDLSGALARLLMLESSIGALPVVDDFGRLIGMLSKTDIVREPPARRERDSEDAQQRLRKVGLLDGLQELDGELASNQALGLYVEDISEPKVRELMTEVVLSVSPDVPVLVAARLMLENDVHHLPVVDARGQLLGIVSPFDFVRAVARLDPQVAREDDDALAADHSILRRGSQA